MGSLCQQSIPPPAANNQPPSHQWPIGRNTAVTRGIGFGNSKRKKKKKKEKEMMMAKKLDTAKGGAEAAGGSAGEGEGGVREGDGVAGWTAEAEAPVMWWWETDDAARVPWGVARLLGLLLR